MLVGILGTGVFFFYMPGMITLLVGYCSTFFETIHYYFLTGDGSPFMAAIKWTDVYKRQEDMELAEGAFVRQIMVRIKLLPDND